MYLIYSLLYTLGFLFMLPHFILRRAKYADGFRQRLGNYPNFQQDGRPVIWLHCVSVGETNAARPLVDQLLSKFPDHRLVVSTTTKTGQKLAQKIFAEKADAVFYFPFDWKFSVKKALDNFKPSAVLLMETEIWPRLIHEAKKSGASVAIVNGRLSEKSFRRYSRVRTFVKKVLENVDLALMQGENDARGIESLGLKHENIRVTGNIKFDLKVDETETLLTERFRDRFGISKGRYLILAASTHSPEERWIVESFKKIYGSLETKPRLLIAPRHPERFEEVAAILSNSGFSVARRSAGDSIEDTKSEMILLDSIGELRAVYPLADVVFVGGSLIPHGGQSVLEPAAAGRAIITGAYNHNFADVVKEFTEHKALIVLAETTKETEIVECLAQNFETLLRDPVEREVLGRNAESVMKANYGASLITVKALAEIVG